MDEEARARHAALVRAGQARARAEGKLIGTPTRVSATRLAECRAMLMAGRSVNYVHRRTGVYRQRIEQLLQQIRDLRSSTPAAPATPEEDEL